MCTVSVVPRAFGFRVVCNRDEKRTRPAALPPSISRAPGVTALWPVDPTSGGTWIGANDAGLAMVILNRTPPRLVGGAHRPVRSRGTIIPNLLRRRSLESALIAGASLPACDFEPFTLLVVHRHVIGVLTNASGRMALTADCLTQPVVYTSSSLGDELVVAPRQALFARMVERQPARQVLVGQAAFHRHRWRSRPTISVTMTRPDAATVSRTILDVDARTARMQYVPVRESD